jgi:hypothetical protein
MHDAHEAGGSIPSAPTEKTSFDQDLHNLVERMCFRACQLFPTIEGVGKRWREAQQVWNGRDLGRFGASGKERDMSDRHLCEALGPVSPPLMTVNELALKVGQNPRLIRRRCDQRRITYRLIGKRRMLTLR